MPHRAQRRFTEVATLGVLEVRLACHQRDLGIGQQCTDARAAVILFIKVVQYQPLPIEVKHAFRYARVKNQPRAAWLRLNEQLYLGIVAQRLKVTNANCLCRYFFFIQNLARVKLAINGEAVTDQTL